MTNGLATAVLVGWSISGAVVLINMLIALMSSTFKEVSSNAAQTWRLERARVIQQMEGRFFWAHRQTGDTPYHRTFLNPLRTAFSLLGLVRRLLAMALALPARAFRRDAGRAEAGGDKPECEAEKRPELLLKLYGEDPDFQVQQDCDTRHLLTPIMEHVGGTEEEASSNRRAAGPGGPSLGHHTSMSFRKRLESTRKFGRRADAAEDARERQLDFDQQLRDLLQQMELHPGQHHEKIEAASYAYLSLLEERKKQAGQRVKECIQRLKQARASSDPAGWKKYKEVMERDMRRLTEPEEPRACKKCAEEFTCCLLADSRTRTVNKWKHVMVALKSDAALNPSVKAGNTGSGVSSSLSAVDSSPVVAIVPQPALAHG